jgi:hypothetical protein
MKSAAAYYLLLFYAIALLKPVIPFVTDFFSHTFALEQHLSNVHHHDGTSHVHKEIAEGVSQPQDEQKTPSGTFDPVSVHVIAAENYSFHAANEDRVILTQRMFTYFPTPCMRVISPPPKAVA